MADCFPQDILIEILLRLPVKTLMAYCCVCKLWREIITDPSFIVKYSNKNHLHRHHQHRYIFLEIWPPKNEFLRSRIIDPAIEYLECPYENLRKFMSAQETNWRVCVLGFCKGLIYLNVAHNHESNMFIVNPSLHRFTRLPKLISHDKCFGGIGYDHVSNDYKVLMFSYPSDDADTHWWQELRVVNLYSLSKNSWKDISDSSQHAQYSHLKKYDRRNTVFMGGFLHWTAWSAWTMAKTDDSRPPGIILRFDFTHEVFDMMCFPKNIDDNDYSDWRFSLAIVFGKFCLSHFGSNIWSIWLMNEYGIEKSWTRQFRVDRSAMYAPRIIHRLVGSSANGELLLFENERSIHSFDPKRKEVKNIGVPAVATFYINKFEESLVLLDRNVPS